uniref:Uncharacterized protein n=1 Tax=uncultured marine virus TaxID=186617 RepID=A0A0F7L5R2_9VIRU|nr:hypothetical protein [uncultured marine virus]
MPLVLVSQNPKQCQIHHPSTLVSGLARPIHRSVTVFLSAYLAKEARRIYPQMWCLLRGLSKEGRSAWGHLRTARY